MEDTRILMNNLTIGVDWLSFTVHTDCITSDVIDFMGFGVEQFKRMPNGANGYKHMLKYADISVLYDGADNMGIHVNITGNSIPLSLEAYQKKNKFENPFGSPNEIMHDYTLSHFCSEVLKIGHFSRIDIAIDDFGANYYTTDELIEKRKQGRIVSKWKKSRNDEEHVVADNEKVGHTVYFGSRKSEILMRVYVTWQNDILKICGKGNKERIVPFGNLSRHFMSEYLRLCPYESKRFFVGRRGEDVTCDSVKHMMYKLEQQLPFSLSSHKLRHNFATNYCLDQYDRYGQVDLYKLMILMGHEDIETTRIYLHHANQIIASKSNISHLDKVMNL